MAKRKLPELSPAQQEIMEIVWSEGEVSASQVRSMIARRRSVARNTVRTMLERMEEKGWLKHRLDGRTYRYSAVYPKGATLGRKVQDIVDTVCGGRPENLVTALIDYRGLNASELDRIQKLLDEEKLKRGKSKGKGR